jgi:surface antigen
MRTPNPFAMLGVASALLSAPVGAAVLPQNEFAETLAQLSDADREAMTRARNEVLAKMQQGAVSIWKNDGTRHSGEARLARAYERNGLPCADVEHILKLTRESRYMIPFCRDASGTWRAAF